MKLRAVLPVPKITWDADVYDMTKILVTCKNRKSKNQLFDRIIQLNRDNYSKDMAGIELVVVTPNDIDSARGLKITDIWHYDIKNFQNIASSRLRAMFYVPQGTIHSIKLNKYGLVMSSLDTTRGCTSLKLLLKSCQANLIDVSLCE